MMVTKEQALEAIQNVALYLPDDGSEDDHIAQDCIRDLTQYIEQSQPVPSKAVRFCRQCGRIGEVTDPKAINCCPEASPEYLHPETAQLARDGFFDDSDEQSQTVPEGYVLVPVEPTREMLLSQIAEPLRELVPGHEAEEEILGYELEKYRALLAAATKPGGES